MKTAYAYDEANSRVLAFTIDDNGQIASMQELSVVEFADEDEVPVSVPQKVKPDLPTTRSNKCSLCGKVGHTKRTCGDVAEPTTPKEPRKQLTEAQFDQVLEEKENDLYFSAFDMSLELGVPLAEVNRAILTRDYDKYLTSYKATI